MSRSTNSLAPGDTLSSAPPRRITENTTQRTTLKANCDRLHKTPAEHSMCALCLCPTAACLRCGSCCAKDRDYSQASSQGSCLCFYLLYFSLVKLILCSLFFLIFYHGSLFLHIDIFLFQLGLILAAGYCIIT